MLNNLRFKKAREQSGQSTVEYIILVTAVIGVIILFMIAPGSLFKTKMTNTLEQTMNSIQSKSDDLAGSHTTPAGAPQTTVIPVNVLNDIF